LFGFSCSEDALLAKLTNENQLTLPEAITARFPGVECFDVSMDGTTILLKPIRPSKIGEVQQHLADLGMTEQDITDAIAWARESH
jgi:hypothetical protein